MGIVHTGGRDGNGLVLAQLLAEELEKLQIALAIEWVGRRDARDVLGARVLCFWNISPVRRLPLRDGTNDLPQSRSIPSMLLALSRQRQACSRIEQTMPIRTE